MAIAMITTAPAAARLSVSKYDSQPRDEQDEERQAEEIDHDTEAHTHLCCDVSFCDTWKRMQHLPRKARGKTSALSVKGMGPTPSE